MVNDAASGITGEDKSMLDERNPTRTVRTIVADDHGALAVGTHVTAVNAFSNLLNVFAPPVTVEIAAPGESTRQGFVRVGSSLRGALGAARGQFAKRI